MGEREELFERGRALMRRWLRAERNHPAGNHPLSGAPPVLRLCVLSPSDDSPLAGCVRTDWARRPGVVLSWVRHRIAPPTGVIQHELGHHVDGAEGTRGGMFSYQWRRQTGAMPLTGYCPNDQEWFAELFRLFVTNPDLLHRVRPSVSVLMVGQWNPVETRTWQEVLVDAPERTRAQVAKKILTARGV